MKAKPISIIVLSAMLVLLSTSLAMVPTVAAESSNFLLDSSTCSVMGGIWEPTRSTCTLSSGGALAHGKTLDIPHGTTLAIDNRFGFNEFIGFISFGTVTNDGTVTISNSGQSNRGFVNFKGAVTNHGTITISDNGTRAESFTNEGGTVTNYGTLTISNSGSGSFGFLNLPHFTKRDLNGPLPPGTVTNFGSITISNNGFDTSGFINGGTFTNYGTITISNGGPGSVGFKNSLFGIVINHGTITISNSGLGSVGFNNFGTVTNHGTINNCSGPSGFIKESGSTFTGKLVITCV